MIKPDMQAKDIAKIIFEDFTIHQSISVRGIEMVAGKLHKKGELTVEHLRALDRAHNFKTSKSDGRSRRVESESSSRKIIGKFVNQKAFKFEHTTREGLPTTNIWRIQ